LQGISLSVEQFNTLLKIIPSITAALIKEGENVEGFGAEPMAMDSDEQAVASEPKRVKLKPAKSNIEATSDEDEE
jgi:hypothetical protein